MGKKFTYLLLGPAGSGKSTFVAGLSKIDIRKYVAAESYGGANTTKVSTTYEFSCHYDKFKVIDCVCEQQEDQQETLSELKEFANQENGIEQIFDKINDSEFAKRCNNITIQLPCKDNLIPKDCLYDTIVIRDSRGLGDINSSAEIKVDDLGLTYDVNAIIFFSISSIQQPAIFTKIIDSVLQVNLKTPIFSLRRYPKVTINDNTFEGKILGNIKSSDEELYNCILSLGEEKKEYRINNFVFKLPEVEQWAGVIDPDSENGQIKEYTQAIIEFLQYSISMYERLYKTIKEKMLGQYQAKFEDLILSKLQTEKVFDIAASINREPHCKPSKKNYDINRDTLALAKPVVLSGELTEQPFRCEKSAPGNCAGLGIIPSYSYSCVNFRNIFYTIIYSLAGDEYSLAPLFCTFIDIVLEKYTTTASTGYQQQIRIQNAFKFDIFLSVRDACNKILKRNNLANDNNEWKNFDYMEKYSYKKKKSKEKGNSEAIAVFIYSKLIDKLNIMKTKPTINDACTQFVESYKNDEIFKRMKRI